MSKLIDQIDIMLNNSLTKNLYDNNNNYTISLNKGRLNFQDTNLHPHLDKQSLNVMPGPLSRPELPLHNTNGDYINMPSGEISQAKRNEIYQNNRPSSNPKADLLEQFDRIKNNMGNPPQGNIVHKLQRDEIYRDGISGQSQNIPLEIGNNKPPPSTGQVNQIQNNLSNPPENDRIRSRIVGPVELYKDHIHPIPQEIAPKEGFLSAYSTQKNSLEKNTGNPPGTKEDPKIIQNASREQIYTNSKTNQIQSIPSNIDDVQRNILEQNAFPSTSPTTNNPQNIKLSRDEIYNKSLYPNVKSSMQAGTPLFQQKNIPSTPSDNIKPPEGNINASFSDAHRLGNLYDNGDVNLINRGGAFSVFPGATKFFDIFAAAHWLRNIGREFGILATQDNSVEKVQRPGRNIEKGITWALSQFALTALNPTNLELGGPLNAIWNPLSVALSATPFRISPVMASAVGLDYKTLTNATALVSNPITGGGIDRLLLMRTGIYSEGVNAQMLTQLRSPMVGFKGNISQPGGGDTLQHPGATLTTIQGQVDQEGEGGILARVNSIQKNLYSTNYKYGEHLLYPLDSILKGAREQVTEEKFSPDYASRIEPERKLKSLFDRSNKYFNIANSLNRETYSKKFPSDSPDVLYARFSDSKNAEFDGVVKKTPLDDIEVYMPFMFQDLRNPQDEFLYFRAFIRDGFSEQFDVNWNPVNYFGRIDAVPIYQNTGRSINLSFDVVAWGAGDLPIIYKKLHILQSMVYPEFDSKGFLEKGPIIRMRIGDLICGSEKLGLPGYITSLNFSYDQSMWSIEKDLKAPMKIAITLAFTVLHDGNPGIHKYADANLAPDGSSTGKKERNFGAANITVDEDGVVTYKSFDTNIRGIIEKVNSYYEEVGLDK